MESFFSSIFLVLLISGETLWELWPYVFCGALVGEALKMASWKNLFLHQIKRLSKTNKMITTLFFSVLGVVSPLCTYGTIPIILQLFKIGVPLPLLLTFLVTSSLMNPQLFIMTWGGLGFKMAVVRSFSVLLFGFILGLATFRLKMETVANPALFLENMVDVDEASFVQGKTDDEEDTVNRAPARRARAEEISVCQEEFVPHEESSAKEVSYPADRRVSSGKLHWFIELGRGTLKSLQFVGFYFLLGIILGSMVEVLLPGQYILLLFKPGKWLSVVVAALLGMPLYACGGGTIPLVRSLMREGMSNGAALAFFLVGPATRITPLISLATIIKPLFIGLYIVLVVLFSVVAGFIYG